MSFINTTLGKSSRYVTQDLGIVDFSDSQRLFGTKKKPYELLRLDLKT